MEKIEKEKSCQGKFPENFPKHCINMLFSIAHLVLCQIFYAVYC